MRTNAKAMPINNNDYSCHIANSCRTCLTNCMRSLSRHIMPLVINSLGGGHTHKDTHTKTHTHTHKNTHTHRHTDTQAYRCSHRNNFRKPGAHRPAVGAPGLKWNFVFTLKKLVWPKLEQPDRFRWPNSASPVYTYTYIHTCLCVASGIVNSRLFIPVHVMDIIT